MNILRGFQVINQDGGYSVGSTYNTVNQEGEITELNQKDSFFAVDEDLISHISAIQQYIKTNRLNKEDGQ